MAEKKVKIAEKRSKLIEKTSKMAEKNVHWVPHHGTSGYHGNPHSSTPFDNFASVKVRHLADLKST